MPQDFITLKALIFELDKALRGAKIDKISQPEKDEIVLSIRSANSSRLLVISAGSVNPRIHLTTVKKFNPYAAPSFCMLLRKYLNNAIINSIEMLNSDRIVKIDMTSRNEMFDVIKLSFIVEIMGRYSNIILIDDKNKIIDAIRHVPPDEVNTRIILPNLTYSEPIQNKIKVDDYTALESLLDNFNGGDLPKYLTDNIGGLARDTAEEICCLGDNDKEEVLKYIRYFNDINNSPLYKPCILYLKNEIKDFLIMPYRVNQGDYVIKNTLNEAVDSFFSIRDKKDRIRAQSKDLINTVKNLIKRAEKSLGYAEEKLKESEKAETFREYGDMLLANIYKIKKGMTEIELDDFFRGGRSVIPLDITLNPQQNAAKYYKKFTKLSRSKSIVTKQKEEITGELQYLKSVLTELSLSDSVEEIDSIREELISEKILKEPLKTNKKKQPVSQPRMYEIEGFKVYSGRNNLENDFITFKLANSGDLFLHAQKIHGSHTIILAEGRKIPDYVVEKAAQIAAYYSEARESDKVAVDYTIRKNVKKHPSGKKGMVIYTDFSTAFVKPSNDFNLS